MKNKFKMAILGVMILAVLSVMFVGAKPPTAHPQRVAVIDTFMSGNTLADGITVATQYILVDKSVTMTGASRLILKSVDITELTGSPGSDASFIMRVGVVTTQTGNTSGKVVWLTSDITASSGIDLNLQVRQFTHAWPEGGVSLRVLSGSSLYYVDAATAQTTTYFAENDVKISPGDTVPAGPGDLVLDVRPLVVSGSTALGTILFKAIVSYDVE